VTETTCKKRGRTKSGFALLIVILIVAVLAAMVSEFLFGVRLQAELLSNHRNGLKCRYIGRSAFNTYKYLLDMNLLSSSTDQNLLMLSTWVGFGSGMGSVEGSAEISSLLGVGASPLEPNPEGPLRGQWSVPLPTNIFGLEGTMYGRLTNERGKLNLNGLITPNTADRTQDAVNKRNYNRLLVLFERLGMDANDALICLDGLVDWIDGNFSTEPRGAEQDYYRSLPKHPYSPRNDFFQSVDEMRLVRGCTPDMVERIKPFVTVYPRIGPYGDSLPDSRVDAATAPKEVLIAIFMAPVEDAKVSTADPVLASQIAEEIYTKAVEKCEVSVTVSEDGSASVNTPSLLSGSEINQIINNRLQGNFDFYNLNSIDAQFYHIDGIGEVNGVRAGVEAVVKKSMKGVDILSWRED
jgi:type II secretory pathway component PulK